MPPETPDAYIATFPAPVQELLQRIRALVREEAPEATERMAYGIPTFWLEGNLVHYGGFKGHVGLYPTPSGVSAFEAELTPHGVSKGSIRFPLSAPLPEDLIRRIVRFRVLENLERAAARKGSKQTPS